MDDSECKCIPDFPDELYVSNIKPLSQEELLKQCFSATAIFGQTPVRTTTKTTFKLKNTSKVTHTYTIERSPHSIFRYFECKLENPVVERDQYLQGIVSYNPQVVDEKNVEHIHVVDEKKNSDQILLEGESVGPKVEVSTKKLLLYKTKNLRNVAQNIELRNTSKVDTMFQFDVNREAEPLFTVDKLFGRLKSQQHVFIKVKFVGKSNGVFYQSLTCLFSHHPPIMIHAIGVSTQKNCDCFLKNPPVKTFQMHSDYVEGYGGFLYDSLKTTISKPPFTLSNTYLNFGFVELKNSSTMITCLTNHLSDSINVVWENDQNPPFLIRPKDVTIPPGQSVLYECSYHPAVADQLDLGILRGVVYLDSLENVDVSYADRIVSPLAVCLRLFGHSFLKNKEWLPRIQLQPSTVILPPTVPNIPTYSTFLMKNFGHLPTSFTFLPPEKTYFLIKPMTGIVYDYQILVVQLRPDNSDQKVYVEKWYFELNGRTDSSFAVTLQGCSEQPRLTVGLNNLVAFTPVFPGCQDTSMVMIRNPSIHCLAYEFEKKEDLEIDHPKGELGANEFIFLKWHCTGRLKAPEVQTVICKLRNMMQRKVVTGFAKDLPITYHTKSCYSKLCAFPKEDNFGYICFGDTKATTFQLFNFGEASVHFKLTPLSKPKTDALTVTPSKGTVRPRQKVTVKLEVKANKSENVDIRIVYEVRINETSDVVVDDNKPSEVFHLRFFGKYPTLQIEDILSHNFGFLFSKITLWDLLNIDEINKILEEIQHDEIKNVVMYFPDFEMGQADFHVILMLKNVTEFDTEVQIKRIKNCDCKAVGKSLSMSSIRRSTDCIHKDICKLTLSDHPIRAHVSQKLQFDVKYLEHGMNKYLYRFTLSENRIVNFYINIHTLPEIVRKPSTYTRQLELSLKDVFIGEKEPAAQVLPLYNNSEFIVNYEIDTKALLRLNCDYNFEIFNCLNPHEELKPFSSENVLFVFTPIETRKYDISVPVLMGDEHLVLKIHGEGVAQYVAPTSKTGNKMPLSSKMSLESEIELSVNHLVIEPFPGWSKVRKLFFIRNRTPDRIIGYSWLPCSVGGIVKVEAVYPKGILQPNQSQPIIIRVQSYDQPCQLRLQLVCKLLDHTQFAIHKESLAAYTTKQNDLKGQFSITEHGTSYPINDVVVQPRPETLFTTLSLDISITSNADRDLHASLKEQMKPAPQYSLKISMQKIIDDYFQNDTEDEKTELEQTNDNKENRRLFKTVTECLLADVMFTNIFCNVLKSNQEIAQPFYNQFILKDSVNKNEDMDEQQQQTIRRLEIANDFLNKPPAPLLASILQQLIADGIHEAFKLGPQGRLVLHTSHNKSTKRKFECSICKRNL